MCGLCGRILLSQKGRYKLQALHHGQVIKRDRWVCSACLLICCFYVRCLFALLHKFAGFSCKICPLGCGSYTSLPKSQRCTPCGPGEYSKYNHSKSCTACEAGKYTRSDQEGMTACTECTAGTYQPDPGKYGCEICEEVCCSFTFCFYFVC